MKSLRFVILFSLLFALGCKEYPVEIIETRGLPTVVLDLTDPFEFNHGLATFRIALRDSLDIPTTTYAYIDKSCDHIILPVDKHINNGTYYFGIPYSALDSLTIINKWCFSRDSSVIVLHFNI